MADSGNVDKKNIVKMAYIYFQEGRWDKAIEEYKKLISLDPEDTNAHNMLGDVYVKKGAIREAFEEYNRVSTDLSTRGQTEKVIIVNKKIASLDPTLLPADAQKKQSLIKQTFKAENAMEHGDMESAIGALSEVIKLDPDNLAAYSKLGDLFEKNGRFEEAVKEYLVLGEVFLKNRLYKKAQEMFQKVVQLEPNNTDARVNLAQIYIKQGSEGDAKKEFLIIAELALNQNDMERATLYSQKAVEFKSIEAHYILGMVYFRKQQFSEAKVEFENLLRFKVNHVGALAHLGKVLLLQNQADKATEIIQKALKLEKDNLMALEVFVELSLKKGAKNEATQTLNLLVDRYDAKKDTKKAIEFARYLVSVNESDPAPETRLGDLLLREGDKDGAADAYFKAAMAFDKHEKKPQAQEFLRKALELNPGHSEAQKRVMGEVVAKAPQAEEKQAVPQPSVPAAPAKASKTDVLDLEQEVDNSPTPPPKQVPAPAAPSTPPSPVKSTVMELESSDDWRTELSIADNYVKQEMVEEAIEIYQRLAEAHPEEAGIKEKLNQAYTAYVKTGEDVLGALEAEKKVKEEEDKRIHAEMEKKAQEEVRRLQLEMEQKARMEAEVRIRMELERKAKEDVERKIQEEAERKIREEAERKVQEEAERNAREGAERKIREEAERKVREEAERKVREEAERRAREEMDKRAHEEAVRKVKEEAERKVRDEEQRKIREEAEARRKEREEKERKNREESEKNSKKNAPIGNIKVFREEPTSKSDSLVEDGKDEFMTIAVADIYARQGLLEEAIKIYKRILQMEPDNLEASKKLKDVESRFKSITPVVSAPIEAAPALKNPAPIPVESQTDPPREKNSDGKKKSNRVGYV